MTDRRSKCFMLAVSIVICACMYCVAATQRMTEEQQAKESKQNSEDNKLSAALFAEARYRAQEVDLEGR